LILNGHTTIGKGVSIITLNDATLELGDNVYINSNSTILCSKNVKIGDGTKISWDVEISDTDLHRIIRPDSVMASPIEIGTNVLVGRRSMIMKGVKIGDGSVIAAGSIVTRNVPEKCLAAGIPAKVIKQNIQWK
jgi:acetyltransferase-like isoleucine patch superfamily enzyme